MQEIIHEKGPAILWKRIYRAGFGQWNGAKHRWVSIVQVVQRHCQAEFFQGNRGISAICGRLSQALRPEDPLFTKREWRHVCGAVANPGDGKTTAVTGAYPVTAFSLSLARGALWATPSPGWSFFRHHFFIVFQLCQDSFCVSLELVRVRSNIYVVL